MSNTFLKRSNLSHDEEFLSLYFSAIDPFLKDPSDGFFIGVVVSGIKMSIAGSQRFFNGCLDFFLVQCQPSTCKPLAVINNYMFFWNSSLKCS
jgi:hypothetical protein